MKLARDRYGYDVYGLDIDDNCISMAARLIGDPNRVFNGMTISVRDRTLDNKFDIIHSNQNIEHLLNPNAYVKKFHEMLSSGGLLFLSFPTSDSFVFKFLREKNCMTQVGHISMFSEKSITSVLKENGFANITYQHVWVDISALEILKKLFGIPFIHRNVYIKSRLAILALYIPMCFLTGILHTLQHLKILRGNYAYVFAEKSSMSL